VSVDRQVKERQPICALLCDCEEGTKQANDEDEDGGGKRRPSPRTKHCPARGNWRGKEAEKRVVVGSWWKRHEM
jgi:hypothetical protein